MTTERRASILTDDDFNRIEASFDRRLQTWAEVIGYDLSTPESRAEIYEDHRFARQARRMKGRVLAGFIAAVGSGISMMFYVAVQWILKIRGPS